MATRIVVPREGQSMERATLVKWDVSVGDEVKFGDVLCEAESEKASFDIESAVSGKVLALLFPEGSEVPVLSTIAIVGKEGEDISGMLDSAPVEAPKAEPAEKITEVVPEAAPQAPKAEPASRRRISPRAFKLAEDMNVPIDEISADPIHEEDVIAYLEAKKAQAEKASAPARDVFTLEYQAKTASLLRYLDTLNCSPMGMPALTVSDLALFALARAQKAYGKLGSDIAFGGAYIENAPSMSLYGLSEAATVCTEDEADCMVKAADMSALGAVSGIPSLGNASLAIGIGGITLSPIRTANGIEYEDIISLSIAADANAVSEAEAAEFMKILVKNIEHIDMLAAR